MSKIVPSVSEEGLGIGDASMVFAGDALSSVSAVDALSSMSAGDALSSMSAGDALSSMSAGSWLFSVSVGDRVSSSKSRSLSVTECLQVRVVLSRPHPTHSSPTHYGLTSWLKRIKIHKLESRRGTPLELDTVTRHSTVRAMLTVLWLGAN